MAFLQPLKKYRFLPLLVSKIYHTLQFSFFLTLLLETASRVALGKYSLDFVGGVPREWHVFAGRSPILADPVCSCGPRTIESISKLLLSIWKKIDFQGFLGIEVSQEGGMGSQINVQRTFLGKKSICEFSLKVKLDGPLSNH